MNAPTLFIQLSFIILLNSCQYWILFHYELSIPVSINVLYTGQPVPKIVNKSIKPYWGTNGKFKSGSIRNISEFFFISYSSDTSKRIGGMSRGILYKFTELHYKLCTAIFTSTSDFTMYLWVPLIKNIIIKKLTKSS